MQKLWQKSLVIALLLGGCSSDDSESGGAKDPLLSSIVIKAPISKPDNDAVYQLTEATKSVSASIAKLAEIQRAQHPDYYKTPHNVVKAPVSATVSMNYIGPIEPLLRKLAKSSHLKYGKLGKQNGSPIIVSIDAKNSSLADVVKDIAYQAQNHAVVEVTKSGVLQIRYLNI